MHTVYASLPASREVTLESILANVLEFEVKLAVVIKYADAAAIVLVLVLVLVL